MSKKDIFELILFLIGIMWFIFVTYVCLNTLSFINKIQRIDHVYKIGEMKTSDYRDVRKTKFLTYGQEFYDKVTDK